MNAETYWRILFGDRDAYDVVEDFGLTDPTYSGVSEWVDSCEAVLVAQGYAELYEISGATRADVIRELQDAIRDPLPF